MIEQKTDTPVVSEEEKSNLRLVDLNLLTVFDVVMQEQHITRAAQVLGMSQPAVSNAVARLKVMFNDELFVRSGRGIQPTVRACQLFGPIRQALQLVQNELPGAGFDPLSSERVFHLCVCSPIDSYLTSIIYNKVKAIAPNIQLAFRTSLDQNIEHQLRYQEVEFVIGYEAFHQPDFSTMPLFLDEMVLVVSRKHPRWNNLLTESDIWREGHAAVVLDRYASFSQVWYDSPEKQGAISYQGMALTSVLGVVSQTHLVAIAPRWLAKEFTEKMRLAILPLPLPLNNRTCYLSWHDSASRDKGHQWMEQLLMSICRR
ncbi:MAG TPA: transcriptional regulator LeuO [Enterobacteriaceae bacterium]|nr:transcriptional regulator LeuO [Enterobacteriaceae bacterium]